MSHQKFTLVLRKKRRVTPRVMVFTFTREDGQSIDYIPGQFITLHIPWDEIVLRRSYSIATLFGEVETIDIAVTEVHGGRATGVLFDLKPGERIEATGPFGRFILRDDQPCRYILVATGTGVSPYRAMLSQLRQRLYQTGFEAILLLGVRNMDELLFRDDFEELAGVSEKFAFCPSFSRYQPEHAGCAHYGYVQHQLKGMRLDPERDIVYLCGNPNMIDDAVKHLKSVGFQNPRIRREKYVSSN